jgi:hypothetical protein
MVKMPDFLVIGVAKAGTTSIYHYLAQHPQIAMSAVKEPHFFEFGEPGQPPPSLYPPRSWSVTTLPGYQGLFAGLPANRRLGEASPSNIEARACARISRYLPAAQFICSLRQPVERAYSAFNMQVRRGNEPEPDFRRAYLDSPRRWAGRFELGLSTYAYYDAGWYVERLTDWLTRFSRQQLHIALYDDLAADPVAFMRAIYAFLEVDDGFLPDVATAHNRGSSVRSGRMVWLFKRKTLRQWASRLIPRPARRRIGRLLRQINAAPMPLLDPALRSELTRPQHDDILRLQDLIGRDLSNWLAK